jgi:chromosome segregation ATPase
MELTPKQLKKLKKIEKMSDDDLSFNLAIIDSFEEVEDKVEQVSEVQNQIVSELETIKQSIEAIEIPIPKDYADAFTELKQKVEEPQEITVTLNII